jgi:hypothetical protein
VKYLWVKGRARGLTVMEWQDKQAKDEIRTLGKEIGHLLKITIVK